MNVLRKPQNGMFLTFEGGEGSGKSTQARLLAEYCQQSGLPFIITREPGGAPAAELVRAVIVRGDTEFHPLSELLLMNAARIEHVRSTILPALMAGKIVICDRFVHSSMAYQGEGRGLGQNLVQDWHERLMPGFYPDHTFLLRIDPEIGLRRSGGAIKNEDRFEKAGLAFHQKIAGAFDEIAAQSPEKFSVLDAQGSVDDVHHACVVIFNRLRV